MADLLKDMYNEEVIDSLIKLIEGVYPEFESTTFKGSVFEDTWDNLELKERMHHIALKLYETLDKPYPEALGILVKASAGMKGFESMIFPDFVESFGLDHYDISIYALEEFTKLCSSEFAIRQFILKYPEQTMQKMLEWSEHENFHVRRLASEGCRPRLPWAVALPEFKKDPAPVLPILENLKDDSEEYVRRSVANNLNDITKDNPELVLDIAEHWYGDNENRDKIIKHALRTLLKQGNKRALMLFGFADPDEIKLNEFSLDKAKVKEDEYINFTMDVTNGSSAPTKLRAEYSIGFTKAKGKTSAKVFQIIEKELQPGEQYETTRTFQFKQRTTRKLYSGPHKFTLILNGKPFKTETVELEL